MENQIDFKLRYLGNLKKLKHECERLIRKREKEIRDSDARDYFYNNQWYMDTEHEYVISGHLTKKFLGKPK